MGLAEDIRTFMGNGERFLRVAEGLDREGLIAVCEGNGIEYRSVTPTEAETIFRAYAGEFVRDDSDYVWGGLAGEGEIGRADDTGFLDCWRLSGTDSVPFAAGIVSRWPEPEKFDLLVWSI